MPGAMDVDRVGLPATALDDPSYLCSLVESDMPCSREGWAQSQQWTTNVLSYAHTQAGTHEARSEVHSVRPPPPMHPVFTQRISECPASVVPAVEYEKFSAIWDTTKPMNSSSCTTCRYQRPKMPIRETRTSLIQDIGGISAVNSYIAQTLYADHDSGGEPTGWREDMVNLLSIQRRRLPESVLQDQELPIPASIDKENLVLPVLFPSYQISHVSFETQGEFLEASPDSPRSSQEPMERGATTSFSRNKTSPKQAKHHGARYQCEICRKVFAQPQGVRRHRLEKHEPNFCPHCHTFSWGRLYQFKQHLTKEHPEVDLETAALNVAKRCHQSVPIATTDRTCLHVPLSRSTCRRRSRGDTRCATALSSPTEPRSSPSLWPLDPLSEALDSECKDARPGAPYPSKMKRVADAIYPAASIPLRSQQAEIPNQWKSWRLN